MKSQSKHRFLISILLSIMAGCSGGGSSKNQDDPPSDPAITASFSAYPLHGAPSLTVSFTGITTGEISSYEWKFGDGGSSTAQDPTHNYTQAGIYTVVLIVSDQNDSVTAMRTNYITVAPVISSNTFYVDQNHVSANDSGLGTETQPWLTIQHAADTMQVGDTVIVKTGTYDERVIISSTTSGTPGNKITFKAEPSRSVLMQGFRIGGDYIRVEGFNITNDITGSWLGGGIWLAADYVEVVDNYFYEVKTAAVQATWGNPWPKAAYVADNRIYYSQKGIIVAGEDWLIENNEIERLYQWGNGDCDYTRFFGENIIFRNNSFHSTSINEIGTAHVDGFQTFDNNGEYARNILIEGNVVRDFHQGFMGEAGFYGNSSNIIFRNNIFADSWSWGLAIQEISNVVVVHNVFANMTYHGVGFANGASGIVKNNIFYNAGSNYWADEQSTVKGGFNILNREGYPNYREPTDLVLDPLFVDPDPENYDFTLQEFSQAIDTGVNVGVTQDIEGTLRPQGDGFDIGAYEYTGP